MRSIKKLNKNGFNYTKIGKMQVQVTQLVTPISTIQKNLVCLPFS